MPTRALPRRFVFSDDVFVPKPWIGALSWLDPLPSAPLLLSDLDNALTAAFVLGIWSKEVAGEARLREGGLDGPSSPGGGGLVTLRGVP